LPAEDRRRELLEPTAPEGRDGRRCAGCVIRYTGALFAIAVLGVAAGCGEPDEVRETPSAEHAVLIHLKTEAIDFDRVLEIEDALIEALGNKGIGEVDGHELALDGSEVVYYLYGPDADSLYDAVEPVVLGLPPQAGSYVVKRYGEADDPDAREVRIDF
jgi:hypothetical protein